MVRRAGSAFLGLLLLSELALAGEYNEVLNIGDPAPSWTDLPGVDGQPHSLADFKDKEVVVVVFTCNSCPIAVDYEDRIIALAGSEPVKSGRVGVVAINVNTIEADRLDKMKERAESKGFNFPYLYDESQKIAKAYGAIFTPEFFVLDRDRKIAYMGGMDDNSNPNQVMSNFLSPAIEATLAGKAPEVKETVARGCRIRYARERRKS